jgi:hypothetical protein
VDLVIAEYPDGLPVPGVSEFPGQVPIWNKHVQNFIKFTIGFCQGYLHDDGALLLFYLDSVQIKKEVLSFLYNNNLEVKEEWTIINSLHLTHPVHNSKRVYNFSFFFLFPSSSSCIDSIILLLIWGLCLISRLLNSKPSFWFGLSSHLWLGNPRSLSFLLVTNLKMLTLHVMTSFSTLSPLILHSSATPVTNFGGALRRRQCPCFSF